ncbi:hypothetical protein SO802_002513 [Lithocarpus litseifolius]|uniref:Uncharacterized protein n=1 Tax=Lithocarpus litseifolius TaxID=425828 RepID=A0AAW2E182_9ROSI
MSTSTDNAHAEKIAKMMNDKNKMLKGMGAGLTRIEESRFKSPMREEEEEEMEDWDEKHKAEYEKNKKFEKLIVDILSMKEKKEKMQLAFQKAQGMDDYLYNVGRLGSKVPIPLPPKFKIYDAEMFDGSRNPNNTLGDT